MSVNGHAGWLLEQLPAGMRRDRVIAGFVRAFEEIGDSVREQVTDIEYELDVNLASPEMLAYMASWIGVDIDSPVDIDDYSEVQAVIADPRFVPPPPAPAG
ncbi:hypothetical protein ACFQ1S_43605, partial [Kibdelosporangium lantanae]